MTEVAATWAAIQNARTGNSRCPVASDLSPTTSLGAIDLPALTDRIWFTSGPGALDMRRLFEVPEEWPRARETIQVFKFHQQHTEPAASIVGPNTSDALVRSNAFSRITRDWNKGIALEAGAVKDFYCTSDASGMDASICRDQRSIHAIRSAGGTLTYLAMDEPFIVGRGARCAAHRSNRPRIGCAPASPRCGRGIPRPG